MRRRHAFDNRWPNLSPWLAPIISTTISCSPTAPLFRAGGHGRSNRPPLWSAMSISEPPSPTGRDERLCRSSQQREPPFLEASAPDAFSRLRHFLSRTPSYLRLQRAK